MSDRAFSIVGVESYSQLRRGTMFQTSVLGRGLRGEVFPSPLETCEYLRVLDAIWCDILLKF